MGLYDKYVKMKGLNRRTIAVVKAHVNFLEEQEIDGTIVTNVHFTNGRWATAGHPLTEVEALLSHEGSETAEEQGREKKQLESWRRLARGRAEAQREVNEALALAGPALLRKVEELQQKGTMPDGSGRLVIQFEPTAPGEKPGFEE